MSSHQYEHFQIDDPLYDPEDDVLCGEEGNPDFPAFDDPLSYEEQDDYEQEEENSP